MAEASLLAAGFGCAVCGMAWYALAMQVHWVQVRGRVTLEATAVRNLRVRGTVALLGSLALCLAANHVSMAVLVWVMMLSVSAVLLALTFAYRPRSLRFLLVFIA